MKTGSHSYRVFLCCRTRIRPNASPANLGHSKDDFTHNLSQEARNEGDAKIDGGLARFLSRGGGYTVGLLVQTNFGGNLIIAGVPIGKGLEKTYPRSHRTWAMA
jgi:hypothetical protein